MFGAQKVYEMIVQMKFLYFPAVLVIAVNILLWSPVSQHTVSCCTEWCCVEIIPQHAGLNFLLCFIMCFHLV